MSNPGIHTVWIGMADRGGCRGFGGMCLDGGQITAKYVAEVCALFGVRDIEEIKGRECTILRSFSGMNEPIEGVEVEGRRFTHTGFVRRTWPEKAKSKLERERESLLSNIAHNTWMIQQESERLAQLESDYRDWEVP